MAQIKINAMIEWVEYRLKPALEEAVVNAIPGAGDRGTHFEVVPEVTFSAVNVGNRAEKVKSQQGPRNTHEAFGETPQNGRPRRDVTQGGDPVALEVRDQIVVLIAPERVGAVDRR